MTDPEIRSQIFTMTNTDFESLALSLFNWQAVNIPFYKKYLNTLGITVDSVQSIFDIPFLPISFFKNQILIPDEKEVPKLVFESSGTTGQINSKHYVKDASLYEESFQQGFTHFFGEVSNYCILGLLPSYLEKGNSSLVYMVNDLIEKSKYPQSGFYLHNHQELAEIITTLEEAKQPTILFGVTYALLDFAESFPQKLNYVKIMETGGMKGRRKELTRTEVHQQLQKAFSQEHIYSEYGMTELFSQAYSLQNEIFETPPWMKILVRDVNNPFEIKKQGRGIINVIDLANIYSCAFIATDDMGELFTNATFKVNGRLDNSDLRGCSLMIADL